MTVGELLRLPAVRSLVIPNLRSKSSQEVPNQYDECVVLSWKGHKSVRFDELTQNHTIVYLEVSQ